jgi:hypothetical protein
MVKMLAVFLHVLPSIGTPPATQIVTSASAVFVGSPPASALRVLFGNFAIDDGAGRSSEIFSEF